MEKNEIKDIAVSMTGKSYRYNKKIHKIESHRLTDRVLILHTDKENIPINHEDIEFTLQQFEPLDQEHSDAISNLPKTINQQMGNSVLGQNSSALNELIMENIKKIKDNPEYIPQAEAINNQLKSLIELGKTQVEMAKVQVMSQKITM